LIERARAAKCSALVTHADLPNFCGQRHKDLEKRSSPPRPSWTPATIANLMTNGAEGHRDATNQKTAVSQYCGPLWTASRGDNTNLSGYVRRREQFDSQPFDWERSRKSKEQWRGKGILKGILDAEDAQDGHEKLATVCEFIVSNHGGRQLDGALRLDIRVPPSILGTRRRIRSEVHMDSGIRSGQDVLKSMADGGKAPYSGPRVYLWTWVRLAKQA